MNITSTCIHVMIHTHLHTCTYISTLTLSNTSSFAKIIFSYIVFLVVDIHPLLLLPQLVSNLFWNMFYSESMKINTSKLTKTTDTNR